MTADSGVIVHLQVPNSPMFINTMVNKYFNNIDPPLCLGLFYERYMYPLIYYCVCLASSPGSLIFSTHAIREPGDEANWCCRHLCYTITLLLYEIKSALLFTKHSSYHLCVYYTRLRHMHAYSS